MALPSFNRWIIKEAVDLENEKNLVIRTDGKFDQNLQILQANLNKIFADVPTYSKDPKYGVKLVEDGKYGDRTAQRIKDFQLLLKIGFSAEGAKKVKIDGKPSPAVFYTAKDIAEMGNQKAFSLK